MICFATHSIYTSVVCHKLLSRCNLYTCSKKYFLLWSNHFWIRLDCTGADLGGAWGPGPPPPPDPPFWGPNFCRRRDSAVRCRQTLCWAPLTQILDPHCSTYPEIYIINLYSCFKFKFPNYLSFSRHAANREHRSYDRTRGYKQTTQGLEARF